MSNFLDHLSQRVLLCDGAMGTQVQARNLDLHRDYMEQENCTEILNKSRPDLVREIHATYLAAGSDMVQTNSFGGSPITLGEFGLRDEAFAINQRAGELANEAIDQFKGDGRTRFALGSVGPGTRLPTLGHIAYQELEDALTIQCSGLIAGGVSAILIETCQDPLQIKAAVNGAKRARAQAKTDTPVLVQVTVETTGTLLVGADIAAAATVVDALGADSMGLNCATGPQEMAEHVRWLGRNWRRHISVQPNAGLPELIDGKTHYPLGPDEIARWQERFVVEEGVSMVGGCCGTVGKHIAALDEMLKRVGAKQGGNAAKYRPAPVKRTVHWVPSLASLYTQVDLRQENAYLSIGERCNANGSKKFRELQDAQDWDGCVAMGKDQEKEGSHALDLCAAYVGHDEVKEMSEVITRMRGAVRAPLVIDSTEYPVLEASLALYGGKPVINSINFEDGEEPAAKRLRLAKKFGAAVIALTIDEEGMAKTVEQKVAVAKRLYDFAVNKFALAPSDLLFDPLTFTICTGNEDDRKLGLATLEGIERIATELPECQIILGLSNISFGLNPAARHVLNSVYLDHALKRGLTGAIVHVARIMPLHKIPEEERIAAEDLIYDRRRDGYDPLQAFIALFGDRKVESTKKERSEHVEVRLKERIIDGNRQGLDVDLTEALAKYKPLDIINTYLLDGMKVVGELFGAGKMQLPFVLQSAETMKAAVAFLQPHMEKSAGPARGTIVLATVRGDVHDIGKNLVDIILTNNGYRVVNLGIKQPIQTIMDAAKTHTADAVGMSGLLVKSTVIMRENLEEMTRAGFDMPVLLGGAALTRSYVEDDCVNAYGPKRVAYAQDAFDGLGLMAQVMEGSFDRFLAEQKAKRDARGVKSTKKLGQAATADLRPVDVEGTRLRRDELNRDLPVPVPPFFGSRLIEKVNVKALMSYLNETMLFQFHWGYRKQGKRKDEFDAWAQKELRPIIARIAEQCIREEILKPQAVYGYWHAAAEGNDLILFGDNKAEVARFTLPRQGTPGGLCIADFVRDVKATERDVVGVQLVSVGQHASEVAREWFAADRYQDYLYLHGFGVEITEALAEYVHKRIRHELGFGAGDAPAMADLLRQGYRGSRYSFGYPACPNLSDQRKLLELLGAERIGVSLGEGDQLHPEQSTSALVILHPQARYFSV